MVYVEHITTAESRSDINRLIDHLCSRFKVTVKGSLKYILRIEINHTTDGMELSQLPYINNILSRFGMDNCRPVPTPIDLTAYLNETTDCNPVFEQNLYQRISGSLMYLVTCTRPDLAFPVSYLARFSSDPLECHHTAVKMVFRHLAGTRSMSLKYKHSATCRSSVNCSLL